MSEAKKTVIVRECQSCGATGLYRGMGERDGVAVVCHTCNGTGKETITVNWTPFETRKPARGVSVVLQTNPGICAAPGIVPGGIPFEDWTAGKPFPRRGAEMRQHTCPAWWYQSADYDRKPNWKECGWGAFSSCAHFKDKAKCWERFDKEDAASEKKR